MSMSPRALTLSVASFLVLFVGMLGALLPVPYVVLEPGPAEDTLGAVKGDPLISIKGRKTYPTEGHLQLTTITYRGGPGGRLTLLSAVQGWLDPQTAVVPEETIFPRGSDPEDVDKENAEEMTGSQDAATEAALSELGIPVAVKVESTMKGKPADGVFKAGDKITAVNGRQVARRSDVRDAVQSVPPGKKIEFTVDRAGRTLPLTVGTERGDGGKAQVGVLMKSEYSFKVDIEVGKIGGPSAGLMFSLGIVDKLTRGSLTGGRNIAGTGTIGVDGKIGPIGGIQQKLTGARSNGATVFLTPAANCPDALRARPDGLRLVKVEALADAIDALEALRSGKGKVPPCNARA